MNTLRCFPRLTASAVSQPCASHARLWRRSRILTMGIVSLFVSCAMGTALLLIAEQGLASPPPSEGGPPPNLAPEIVQFVAIQLETCWSFQGYVLDEQPLGLTVRFGGIIDGHSVTVANSNGFFMYNVDVSETGTVTAQTTDSQSLNSNVAECFVMQ